MGAPVTSLVCISCGFIWKWEQLEETEGSGGVTEAEGWTLEKLLSCVFVDSGPSLDLDYCRGTHSINL